MRTGIATAGGVRVAGATRMENTTIWQLDPAHTTVEFAVKHMMFTTVRGRFKTFSGAIDINERDSDESGTRDRWRSGRE